MPRIPFDQLPDDARLWSFASRRPLSDGEQERLLEEVDDFLEGWQAHGHPLRCGRDWRHGRFLLVAVDPRSEPPSGCSIDAMVRTLKEVGDALGTTLVDNAPIYYRDAEGEVARAGRADFRRLARDGEITPDTVVFDATVTRLGDLREGAWEAPARERWHGRAFWQQENEAVRG